MFCSQCGKALKEGSKFCGNCGASVAQVPAKTQKDETDTMGPAAIGQAASGSPAAASTVAQPTATAPIPTETDAAANQRPQLWGNLPANAAVEASVRGNAVTAQMVTSNKTAKIVLAVLAVIVAIIALVTVIQMQRANECYVMSSYTSYGADETTTVEYEVDDEGYRNSVGSDDSDSDGSELTYTETDEGLLITSSDGSYSALRNDETNSAGLLTSRKLEYTDGTYTSETTYSYSDEGYLSNKHEEVTQTSSSWTFEHIYGSNGAFQQFTEQSAQGTSISVSANGVALGSSSEDPETFALRVSRNGKLFAEEELRVERDSDGNPVKLFLVNADGTERLMFEASWTKVHKPAARVKALSNSQFWDTSLQNVVYIIDNELQRF